MSQSTSVLGPVVSQKSASGHCPKSDSIDKERQKPVRSWKMKKEKESADPIDEKWGDLRKLTKPERGFVREVPPPIREQTLELVYRFRSDHEVNERAKRLMRDGTATNWELAKCLVITNNFDTFQLLRLRYFDFLKAWDDDGRYVVLEKFLQKRKSDHVRLVVGTLHNPVDDDKKSEQKVILKWHQSSRRDTRAEVWAYKKLRNLKCRVPWFSSSYMLWKTPVLIIEPLEKISGEDNLFEMMAQITQQLKIVHKIGVHSDIKPGNIMKGRFGQTYSEVERGVDQGDWAFFLIDYGGLATEKTNPKDKPWLYWRHTWTKHYAAMNRRQEDQRFHWVYDLLELVFTVKGLQNELIEGEDVRRRRKRGEKKKNRLPIQSGFSGRLLICYNYVQQLMKHPEKRTEEAYDEFIKICRAPNPKHTEEVTSSEVISPTPIHQASETVYQEESIDPSSTNRPQNKGKTRMAWGKPYYGSRPIKS